ncbi:MAG: LPS export ABC transporter periplasmic protein LptC [Deltaproteobacteria bacterium]|nr:LPS export ABC transporter periplasmic protein LptC [Deltaproteobacteria bacterium]
MVTIKRIRFALLFVSAVAVSVVVGMAIGSKKQQIVIKTDLPAAVKAAGPSVALKNVAYSTTNNDNFKEWDLEAESAQYLQKEKRVILENLSVSVYRPNGKVFKIRGRQGEFNTESRDIKMHGDIWGSMPDNTTIQTQSVDYNHAKRLITTQDKVFIRRNSKFALEGKGMIIDMAKEKLTISSNVKALGSK